MQETGNKNLVGTDRLTIRVGQNSLTFAFDRGEGSGTMVVPYIINAGISMAANLREALRSEVLSGKKWDKALVMLDSPHILVPIDEYKEQNKETMFRYTMTDQENNAVLNTVLPSLNAVAIYALNKDLKLVLTDNFKDIKIRPVCGPVWQYLQRRSMAGNAEKLYCYFHDAKVEIFSFRKNRFRFANTFPATSPADTVYFIMATWQQLTMNGQKDEIYLVGKPKEADRITDDLRRFVENVFWVKPSADFNRHPLTLQEGVPFDMIAMLLG